MQRELDPNRSYGKSPTEPTRRRISEHAFAPVLALSIPLGVHLVDVPPRGVEFRTSLRQARSRDAIEALSPEPIRRVGDALEARLLAA